MEMRVRRNLEEQTTMDLYIHNHQKGIISQFISTTVLVLQYILIIHRISEAVKVLQDTSKTLKTIQSKLKEIWV